MILGDDNPLRRIRRPWVTLAVMAACILVYLLQLSGKGGAESVAFTLVPIGLRAEPFAPQVLEGLFGHMFLHLSLLHIGGNLLALFVFGDNVEDAFGHFRFAAFYVLCGLAGGITHALLTADPEVPLVGASGAIAGVMAAYLMLYPRAKLFVLAFGRWPTLVPASWFVATWIGFNLLRAVTSPHAEVAWWAHVGGFAMGLLLVAVARPHGVALFQPAMASEAPRWPWYRRVAFDFAPEPKPRDPGQPVSAAEADDGRFAAIGKAALFIVLAALSAFI